MIIHLQCVYLIYTWAGLFHIFLICASQHHPLQRPFLQKKMQEYIEDFDRRCVGYEVDDTNVNIYMSVEFNSLSHQNPSLYILVGCPMVQNTASKALTEG